MAAEVEESLRTALLSMSAVTALVGSVSATARIYPYLKQSRQIPAAGTIVIETDSTEHFPDILGESRGELHEVNILCRAPEKEACRTLAEAVRLNGTDPGTGLAGYTGTPIDVEISCWLDDEIGPIVVSRDDGGARPWWDVNMSFRVMQTEVA